jgi:hypothetical protein
MAVAVGAARWPAIAPGMCVWISPAIVRVTDDQRPIVLGSDDLVLLSDDRREVALRPDDRCGRLSTQTGRKRRPRTGAESATI